MSKAATQLPRELSSADTSRVIEMAWEDRTPFEAIETLYAINESTVIRLMRYNLTPRSFKLWRKRVTGRKTKHTSRRSAEVSRGYCPTQYKQR
ncbi:TIGR03643 family protein [uncultured Oceanicoccus sp.]|uniref:TIGR03643 family protein n=1 Tax=uncultured Oceanicoccus sp. TaxID=1706381 RepID=UPI0030DB5496